MLIHGAGKVSLPRSIVTIGAFDGVHRGHQTLIKGIAQRGRMLKVPSVVYTFDPPPRAFFQNARTLSPIHEKIRRMQVLGLDHCIVAAFNQDFLQQTAYQFIDELQQLNPVEIVVGKDFRFGRNRTGDITLLKECFKVRVIEPVFCSKGKVISSTRIRELVGRGENQQAFSLLGWPV
ncbi:FAD synthetase family protein [Sutcliffiella horikoshii]|uniref:FAD synthetase family protein n=1 Tax=Sutcliffiella horikoshii TaxID=79883 RepID=UPI00203B1412|nr:FAD synthetase family protein [Sutcliffiella horikoshii]MCM3617570.1 FAD synthetase family protein [Sutcliffiella horikoshii]